MFSSKKLLYLALAGSLFQVSIYAAEKPLIRVFDYETDHSAVEKIIRQHHKNLYDDQNLTEDDVVREIFGVMRNMTRVLQGQRMVEVCNRKNTTLVLINEENQIAGFVVFSQDPKENPYYWEDTGHIILIAVAKDQQSKGFGKMLAKEAKTQLLNAGCTALSFTSRNQIVYEAAEKRGFVQVPKDTCWRKEDKSHHSYMNIWRRFFRNHRTTLLTGAAAVSACLIYSYPSIKSCISRLWR